MATVQDIYQIVCYDVLEDSGLSLGVLSLQTFIDLLNSAILEFMLETGWVQRIWTQTVNEGVSVYVIPNDIDHVESAYLAGCWLPRATVEELNNRVYAWRSTIDYPRYFHEDGIPLASAELAPIPNYNGAYIPGANEPDPPHGQYDTFYPTTIVASVNVGPTSPTVHRGLTVIGPQVPVAVANLTDFVPLIDDDWAISYLPYAIIKAIFGGDNELQDKQVALFASAQWEEGKQLAKAITGESEVQ